MIKKITSALFLIAFLYSKTFAVLNTPLITAPANASLGNAANALVNWYNVSGSTGYEIKFDTSASLTNTLVQTTTSSQYATSQLLYGTTYYWQVRAVKTTATIDSSNWSQIFSFTTIDTLRITAPSNNAANQFPRTKLDWTSSSGINHYRLQLDEVNTFNSAALLDISVPDSTSYFFTSYLKFGTQYYWRVKGVHALDSTEWTDAYSFTIIDTVSLTSPLNGVAFLSTNVGLNWHNISGIDSSFVELDTTISFNSPYYRSANVLHPNSDWIPHNLHFGTTYYWHVRSYINGDSTQWSQTWSFTTMDAVTLNSPANGAVEQPMKILLNWNTASSPIAYDLDLDTSSAFNSSLHFYASDTTSQYKVSQLYFGAHYYWRVRIRNLVDTSQWSSVYSFTTLDTLNATSPSNGATNQPVKVLLN